MKQAECLGFYPINDNYDCTVCDHYNFANNMCKFFTDHECEYEVTITAIDKEELNK